MTASRPAPPPGYRGGCTPGMRAGCRLDCGHRAIVEAYRLEAAAQAARCEHATGHTPDDDAPEVRAFFGHPDAPRVDLVERRVTFRSWLLDHARWADTRPRLEPVPYAPPAESLVA